MVHLRQLLEEESPRAGRLDRAALDLATIHFPDLDPQPVLDQLNDLASRLGDRLRNFNDGRDFVETAQRFLFGELGFHGNQEDYFDPRNSCLNQVLERRTGLPITLSVMYMEIARRLHMPVYGIGLPRHFILQFDDGNYNTFIDPFHGGRVISINECFALAGAEQRDLTLLRRVSKKQIVVRMLQNLHMVYAKGKDFPRAIATLDLMIAGAPETAEWYQARAALLIETGRWEAARRDIETYLTMRPEAADRQAAVRRIHWLARMN